MNSEGGAGGTEECLFSGDWREWRRLRAWRLKAIGWSQRNIAEAFGVSATAVSRWIALANDGGPSALLKCPSPGRSRLLTDQDCATLEALLAEGATSHGWPTNLWTAGRVAQVIKAHFQI